MRRPEGRKSLAPITLSLLLALQQRHLNNVLIKDDYPLLAKKKDTLKYCLFCSIFVLYFLCSNFNTIKTINVMLTQALGSHLLPRITPILLGVRLSSAGKIFTASLFFLFAFFFLTDAPSQWHQLGLSTHGLKPKSNGWLCSLLQGASPISFACSANFPAHGWVCATCRSLVSSLHCKTFDS